jgi:hypothetical protein
MILLFFLFLSLFINLISTINYFITTYNLRQRLNLTIGQSLNT